ncbi:MAG: Asp-tRNA(Asn)/Glu-tRNA(Gln) amidotransferase subunit GatB [Anaerolineales bacterium]|nr:Asp-tRNA(Asn)/Glu-tRNA(Gln) amidotransferase subunit GatB [Anaerolineales bacterium]
MTDCRPSIGLEVHAQLQTQSKMFCACPVVDSTSARPNSAVCEVCTGMPGTLPVANQRAVEYGLRVALALECTIATTSLFARKNYFYPDLPKGYQISQYEFPLAQGGQLTVPLDRGEKRVRIRRVHLEEDTGKLVHQEGSSLIDYNRSGVPLLEIVTEPDLESVEEVRHYAAVLRRLLRYLGVNSGDMEKGVIRFEANVSVRPQGSDVLGTRTEVKNLNSFRALLRAVAFEIERQSALLAAGQPVLQQTLGWDERGGVTLPQRSKEEAHDYRYFPEPDLPPLVLEPGWIDDVRRSLPELPVARMRRFQNAYGLSSSLAGVLTEDRAAADYFEAACAASPGLAAADVAHWVSGELFSLLNQEGLAIEACPLPPEALAEILRLQQTGRINPTTAKQLLAEVFHNGGSPTTLVEQRVLAQVTDPSSIDALIAQVEQAHPAQVSQYLEGKKGIEQWLFGQVMRAASGKADPHIVQDRLRRRLTELEKTRRPL